MVDFAIGAAISGLKTAAEMAGSFIKLRDEAIIQAKLIELQSVILTAQSSALAAQAEHFTLLDKSRELEKQIVNLEAWNREKDRYQLTEVATRRFAYVLKPEAKASEPTHWLCAKCYQHGKKALLQSDGPVGKYGGTETFTCHECSATFGISTPGNDYPQTYGSY